jgi:hypothetical protein
MATPSDPLATVTGTGVQSLNVGVNQFTITAMAQDGTTTLSYTVTVNRGYNTDATLATFAVSSGELSPAFNPVQTLYTVNVNNDVTEITLTATPTDANATVSGDGVKTLQLGANHFTITVTAQDGITTQTYIIYVERALLGINDIEPNRITVYPNPTEGELRITNYELRDGVIEIYDVAGKKQKAEGRKRSPFLVYLSH